MLLIAKALLGLQLVAALDAESAIGQSPVQTTTPGAASQTETSFTTVVAPSAGVSSDANGGPQFTGTYSPRALWRVSASAPTGAEPLLLHQMLLSYRPTGAERTQLEFQGLGSVGDVDRGAQGQVFTGSQTAPLSEDLRVYNAAFTTNVVHRLTHLWTLRTGVPLAVSGPLGEQDETAVFAVRTSRSVGLVLGLDRALNRRDSVGINLTTQLAEFEDASALSTVGYLSWSRRLSSLSQFSVGAGVGRVTVLESEETEGAAPAAQSGLFGAGTASLSRTRRHGADSLTFGLDAVVDPFTQAIRPTAAVTGTSNYELGKRVNLSAALGASTVTTLRALPTNPNETGVNASVTIDWRLNDVRLSSGLRAALRGPNLDPDQEEPFELRERTIMLFAGVHWDIAGARR
jgi:hypothetical protein